MCALFMGFYFLVHPESHSFIETFQEHALAQLHIWTSWAARIAVICIAIHSMTSTKFSRHAFRLVILLESISIVTGMFWAFDNYAWGALWQWDSIELISLVVWCTLVYGYNTQEHRNFWALTSLLAILTQIDMLLGPHALASRHNFFAEKISLLWPAFIAVWLILLLAICFRMPKTSTNYSTGMRDYFAGLLLICMGILPMTPFYTNLHHTALASIFLILWGILWFGARKKIPFILGSITLIWVMLLPSGPDRPLQQFIWANVKSSEYLLTGVHATPKDDCLHYQFDIEHGANAWTLPYQACDLSKPPQAIDVWDGIIPKRIWAIQYQAAQGVQLLMRNTTPERLFELWIVLLCLWFAVIPTKKSPSYLASAE